jgi:pimeloyl-ACP methyl ester carboxylesterase
VQQQIVSFRLPLAVLNEIRTAGHKGHAARRRINCPVLVIQGNADPLVTPSQTQTYTADWPVAQYCEVSAAHDLVQDERALSQVLPLIFAFLNDGAQA